MEKILYFRGILFSRIFSGSAQYNIVTKSSRRKFFTSPLKLFLLKFMYKSILCYKTRLKSIIINGTNLNLYDLIRKINKEIFYFKSFFNFSLFYIDIVNELDYYLYRLLWKYLKRRHPRRPNTWIYLKYWKPFSRHLETFL